jgi:predicted AlkP superfamily pyrophosphatase or phosphodiesterase
VLVLAICTMGGGRRPRSPAGRRPLVIAVGFDGFRRSYFDADSTPALHALAVDGVVADAMIPSFPTVTFPNWYALATGLYPAHSGIVNNQFFDSTLNATFRYNSPTSADGRWYAGEPVWATAVRHGERSATMFWVGSDAEIGGLRPTYWRTYDRRVRYSDRIVQVLSWIDLPPEERPDLIMVYFEEPDHTGHDFGPDAPETAAAVARVDSALGALVQGLEERGIYDQVNVLVMADHGMAAISPEREVFLSDVVDTSQVRVMSLSPALLIEARDGDNAGLLARLRRLPHVTVWRKGTVPSRLHYGPNSRIPAIVGTADDGWIIGASRGDTLKSRGAHGYDNVHVSMEALFLAHGPAFRAGARLPAFPNVDVYDLLTHLLDLPPAPNDGTLAPFQSVLR